MLFENQLNKTATPSNKINLNSSFSSVSNSTPRPLNTNNGNYSTLNSPWNNNIKKNSIEIGYRPNSSSKYIIKLFLSLCEEIVRICLIENVDSSNFIDIYNKISEVKEKLFEIGTKANIYRKDLQNIFENENYIKNGSMNNGYQTTNMTKNSSNIATLEEHPKKMECNCYTPTSILSNSNISYSPYKDPNLYLNTTINSFSCQNIQTPNHHKINYSHSNQIMNINTIDTSPQSHQNLSDLFNNKTSLLNIYDINIHDYINNKNFINSINNNCKSANNISNKNNNLIESNNKFKVNTHNHSKINVNTSSSNINIGYNKIFNNSLNNQKEKADNHNNPVNKVGPSNINMFEKNIGKNNTITNNNINKNDNNNSNNSNNNNNENNNNNNNNENNNNNNNNNNITNDNDNDNDKDKTINKLNVHEKSSSNKDKKEEILNCSTILSEKETINSKLELQNQIENAEIENDEELTKEKSENIKALKEKLENADKLRMDMLNKRIEKSKEKTQKINELKLKRESSDLDLMKQIQKKQDQAAKKRRVHLNSIKHKAKDENQKSNEIVFIQAMSLEQKKTEVIRRQEESIARKEKIDQTKLEKISKMNELQKINNERRKLLNEIRAEKVKTQHEKKWKMNKRKEVEKKLNNLLNKRLISEQQTKRINEFKNNLIIEEEELRKEINNKVERASKRHAEQIELVKEKAAAVIKHSKTVAERTINKYNNQKEEIKLNQDLNTYEDDQDFEDSVNIDLPIVSINKNIRKQNKGYKKEFTRICQELNIGIDKNISENIDESIMINLDEIKNNFDYYNTKGNPKDMLRQLNSDINDLINYSDKNVNDIIQSKVLLSILEVCLKTEETKWLFPLKFVYRSLQLIEKIAMNQNLLQSIIYLDNPIVFTIINIQSRVLLLLETSEESDYKLSSMIDLIKISTLFFKLINAILEYSYDENRELYDIIVKYLLNTTVFKPINIKFNIKELYSKDSPLNDFYYFASKLYYKVSFIENSWEKPIYEKYNMKNNEISYFTEINSEIINEFIIMMDSLLLYKGYGHSVSTKLSNKMLEISLNVLKTLNNISTLNNESIKNLLNMEIMQNQLFHFISFWLDYWFMWVYPTFTEEEGKHLINDDEGEEENNDNSNIKSDKNNSISMKTASILTDILHELLLTIGYFCLYSENSKSILRLGQRPVILQKLINLPIQYFIHPQYYEILFPTLIISCYNEQNNLRVLQDNFSTEYLHDYLEKELKLLPSSSSTDTDYQQRFKLINRFPVDKWKEAINYFSIKEQS